MLAMRSMVSIFSVAMMVVSAGVATGQDYPNKPVRIFTGGAGGGNDFTSRQIAQGISGPLGQQIIVENRGSSFSYMETFLRLPPDGYTFIITGATVWTVPLTEKVNYDVLRDLAPITSVSRDIFVLVVHPSLPVKSVKELIALAKARPGELNYAATAPGSAQMLAAELFKTMAGGVNIVQINYKSASQVAPALVSGEAQVAFTDANLQTPLVKAGRLRALAVSSATPSALVPGLPTVSAAGLPGYEAVGMTSSLVAAKTPPAIINRLNQEMARFLNRPEVKEKFLSIGQEIITTTPEEIVAIIKSDIAKWGKVIKDAGIKTNH